MALQIFGGGSGGGGSIASSDTLALQRLDRQTIAKARIQGGAAAIAYADATEVSKDWADLTGWANANVQVSTNRLYAVAANNTTGAIKSLSVGAGEVAHFTGLIYWKSGSTTPIYAGLDLGTADHAPANASPDGMFIGVNSAGTRASFIGSTNATAGIVAANDTRAGSEPSAVGDATYAWSIDVGDLLISFSLRKVNDASNIHTFTIARSLLTTAGKTINNLSLFISDGRGTSGHAFSPVAAVKSRQQTRTRVLGGQAIEGVDHRHVATANPTTSDLWRVQVPANYDARRPSPLVLFFHQSQTGSDTTPFLEPRAYPVTDALGDAGFIVASANDGGDRWGNSTSLANYKALYDYVRDNWHTGPLFMLASSMGSTSLLNLLARRTMPTPAAAATIGGVVQLDNLFANNTGTYAPAIRTAYGIAADGSDYASKTAGWNPAQRNGYEFRGVPMRFYTSVGDTTVPKATNQDALAAKVLPFAPEATVVLGSGAHLDASQYQPSDVLSFFQSYL